jgi:N-acetylneuraminate lyase
MNSSFIRLRGLIAATHTPTEQDGRLNLSAVETQARHLVKHGVAGVFIGGTTGESHSFTTAERQALTECWTAVARDLPLRVVVHVGHNCGADAQELARHAERCGAAAISALAPSYFKPPTPRHLAEFLAAIAGAAPRTPFYFYDIPTWTGVNFPASVVMGELAPRAPNFTGVKYTNPDLCELQRTLSFGDGAYDILWGTDEALLAGWSLGCRGAVGSTYNFAAPIYHRVIDAFERQDLDAARTTQLQSVKMVMTIAKYGFLPASKLVMKMLGVDCGIARPPLATLDDGQFRNLRNDLEAIGFFEQVTKPVQPAFATTTSR